MQRRKKNILVLVLHSIQTSLVYLMAGAPKKKKDVVISMRCNHNSRTCALATALTGTSPKLTQPSCFKRCSRSSCKRNKRFSSSSCSSNWPCHSSCCKETTKRSLSGWWLLNNETTASTKKNKRVSLVQLPYSCPTVIQALLSHHGR